MPHCCTPKFPFRSPREFLSERKMHLEKLRERGEMVSEREIEFLTFVISQIGDLALVDSKGEEELIRGIDWNHWISSDQMGWELFADLMDSERVHWRD